MLKDQRVTWMNGDNILYGYLCQDAPGSGGVLVAIDKMPFKGVIYIDVSLLSPVVEG